MRVSCCLHKSLLGGCTRGFARSCFVRAAGWFIKMPLGYRWKQNVHNVPNIADTPLSSPPLSLSLSLSLFLCFYIYVRDFSRRLIIQHPLTYDKLNESACGNCDMKTPIIFYIERTSIVITRKHPFVRNKYKSTLCYVLGSDRNFMIKDTN